MRIISKINKNSHLRTRSQRWRIYYYIQTFSYEVDGFGNHLKIDDANVPSLLSLPHLGFL